MIVLCSFSLGFIVVVTQRRVENSDTIAPPSSFSSPPRNGSDVYRRFELTFDEDDNDVDDEDDYGYGVFPLLDYSSSSFCFSLVCNDDDF